MGKVLYRYNFDITFTNNLRGNITNERRNEWRPWLSQGGEVEC